MRTKTLIIDTRKELSTKYKKILELDKIDNKLLMRHKYIN